VAYDPAWPERFRTEQAQLAVALPHAPAIDHVGSTSGPGLSAKPTIDVLAVVSDVDDVLKDHAALERLGYEYRPGSFADDGDHLFFRKVSGGKRTHHLHVLAASSPRPDDYLLFRGFLGASDDAAPRYEQAKQSLAEKYATERGRYVAEKSQIVDQLMSEARAWRAAGSDS
jgi:GrpB-like predicted nucleotidyltransferase (UPF0157 family)